MLDALIKRFISLRYVVIALLLLCIAAFVHFLPKLTYRIELHSLLKSDSDQTVQDIKDFYKTFPPAQGDVVITVSFDNPITIADLRLSETWAQDLTEMPGVKRVVSSFDKIMNLDFYGFTLNEWVDLAGTENEPVTLGNGKGIDVVHGNFISKDMKSLAFYIQRNEGLGSLLPKLEKKTAEWGYDTRILGINVMLNQGGSLLKEELIKLILLLVLALVVLLPMLLKSFRMSYLPLSISMLSVLMFVSLLAYMNEPINLMILSAPVLITVISLSNTIHLQRYFDNERAKGTEVKDALKVMLKSGGSACFMTTLTTAIGFFSLLVVEHEEIRDMGFWCGVGVMITYLNIMLFFPLLLLYLPGNEKTGKVYEIRFTEILFKYAKPVIVLLLLGVVGLKFAFFDTSIYNELPQESQGLKDMRWFSDNFRGTERVEIEVKGSLVDFDVFQSVERLQEELMKVEGVSSVSSYATLLRYMSPRGVLEYKDGIGPAAKAINNLPEYPRNMMNKQQNHGCLIFYTSSDFGSAQYREFKQRFQKMKPELSDKAEFGLNGYVNMAYDSINYITDSLFYSLGVSILAITAVLVLYLRSISFAVLCLIPNVLPLMVTMGLAGWLNIPISLGFIVILIIGLGLAVDDTVHLVIKFLKAKAEGEQLSIKECLTQAVSTTGYAIIITSVVILMASLTFMQSSFSTLQETGIVLCAVTLSAVMADLFVFPWVLEKYYAFLNKLKMS